MRWLILALVLMTGCVSGISGGLGPVLDGFPLEPRWAPLVKVVSVGEVQDARTTTTAGDTIYVRDVDEWLKVNVPGSVRFDALMRHGCQDP